MTEPQANATASGEVIPEKGTVQRIVGVFTDPGETFADLARKPDFWAPLILMMTLSIASVELFLSKVSIQDIVLHQLEASGRASRMSPEQLQRAADITAKVGVVTWHGMAVVGVPLKVLLLALIGMGIIRLLSGDLPKFGKMWSVATYAFLPSVLRSAVGILVTLFGDPSSLVSGNISPTNVGFFLSQQSVPRPLYVIATSLDPFTFWIMVLMGIGCASLSAGKVRSRSYFFSFFALWLVLVLISAGLAAIMA